MIADEHKNTNKLLWRGQHEHGDFYADSVSVTEGGGIALQSGGSVIVLPIKEWMRAALLHCSRAPSPEEVEAVARAMWIDSENSLKAEHRIKWDGAGETFRAEHLSLARAALAASDAWRAQELERMK